METALDRKKVRIEAIFWQERAAMYYSMARAAVEQNRLSFASTWQEKGYLANLLCRHLMGQIDLSRDGTWKEV